jgi:hypothetical protein
VEATHWQDVKISLQLEPPCLFLAQAGHNPLVLAEVLGVYDLSIELLCGIQVVFGFNGIHLGAANNLVLALKEITSPKATSLSVLRSFNGGKTTKC